MKRILLSLDEYFSTLGKLGKIVMGAIVVGFLGAALYLGLIYNDPKDVFKVAGFIKYFAVGFVLGGVFTWIGLALEEK